MSRAAQLAGLSGVLVAASLCYLPSRPPTLQRFVVTPESVAALAGELAVVSEQSPSSRPGSLGGPLSAQGVRLSSVEDLSCAAFALPVAQAGSGDVSTLNLGLRRLDQKRACDPWWAALIEGLRRADRALPGVAPGAPPKPMSWLDHLGRGLSVLLLGWLFGVGLWALWVSPKRDRRWVLGVFVLAAALRLAVPDRMSMVYFGYELMARARYLDALPRYGPAGATLWSMVLGPLSESPSAILRMHDLLGAVTVSLFSLAASRIDGRWIVGVAVAIVLGLTPLFVRDHGSESLHVGAMLALAVACLAVSSRAPLDRGALIVAAAATALAGLFRADVALLALPTVGVWRYLSGGGLRLQSSISRLHLVLISIGWLLVLALTVSFGLSRASLDLAHHNLPQLERLPVTLPSLLLEANVLLRPELFPLGLWAALVAFVVLNRDQKRWRWLALLPLSFVWLLPYYADFNETSMGRLQVPAATFLAIGAAAMAATLVAQSRRRLWVGAALGLVFLLSAIPTISALSLRTNAHDEDALLSEVRGLLPREGPWWLVTRTYAEGPALDLHLHLPTWIFQPPASPGKVVSAGDYLRAAQEKRLPQHRVFFFQSYRCWMGRDRGRGPSRMHPACATIVRSYVRRVLFSRSVPNRGDSSTFDDYGGSPRLQVGLFQLQDGRP